MPYRAARCGAHHRLHPHQTRGPDPTPQPRTADGTWDAVDSVYVTLSKGGPAGMLLAYHPSNRSTVVLMSGLWFANGVALAHDESYVLVADSLQMRLHRWVLPCPSPLPASVCRIWAC
jgi:sugar lactone lactonase YvrE